MKRQNKLLLGLAGALAVFVGTYVPVYLPLVNAALQAFVGGDLSGQ